MLQKESLLFERWIEIYYVTFSLNFSNNKNSINNKKQVYLSSLNSANYKHKLDYNQPPLKTVQYTFNFKVYICYINIMLV